MGTGCPKCKATEKAVRTAVDELGRDIEIEKVEDVSEIVSRGVMMTPAVVVDGQIKIVGHVPSIEEIKKLLN